MPRSRVRLPREVRDPYQVFLNGVPQRLGADYTVREGALVFERELRKDRISGWRWLLGARGVGREQLGALQGGVGDAEVEHRLGVVAAGVKLAAQRIGNRRAAHRRHPLDLADPCDWHDAGDDRDRDARVARAVREVEVESIVEEQLRDQEV